MNFLTSRTISNSLSRRGLTLLETVVSVSVISVALLTIMLVIRTTSDNLGFELTVADQQVITRSAMDRMMEELRMISDDKTDSNFDVDDQNRYSQFDPPPSPAPGAQSITFGIPKFEEATNSVNYGSADQSVTYRWVRSERELGGNARDDDGNGLIDDDDGRIERIHRVPGSADDLKVICDNVPRDGFQIRKRGRRLEITVARKNNTPRQTQDGSNFTTTVTHVTYSLKNQ